MSEWILMSALVVTVLVVIGLFLSIIVYKKKNEGKIGEPNYIVFFIIGTVWIPIGSVFMITINTVIGIAFMGMGVTYMAIGLVNRDKWKKQ